MLLTLSTTHEPATDLGFLLHKNPERVHAVEMPFGTVTVVYPEATAERCTAALLVEVDPVGLVRNRKGPKGNEFSLAHYVNDRPYAASPSLSGMFKALTAWLRSQPVADPSNGRLAPLSSRRSLPSLEALPSQQDISHLLSSRDVHHPPGRRQSRQSGRLRIL